MSRFLLTALFTVFTAQAYALPLTSTNWPSMQRLFSPLPYSFTSAYNFEGIVRLSNCSGSLIRFKGAQDTDAAMIMTNGHCLGGGFLQPGEVVSHRPTSRTFDLMQSNGQDAGRVAAQEIIYATMTQTDVALYKLTKTYAQIRTDYRIEALELNDAQSVVDTDIEVISGYWQRGYTCRVEAIIPQLRESNWTWMNSARYSRPGCETIGGTSGSPVIDRANRQVVAINNTGNEDGEQCTLNNPCEVDQNGNVSYVQGYSYAQQTYWIYSCLNANRQFDLSTPACQLPH